MKFIEYMFLVFLKTVLYIITFIFHMGTHMCGSSIAP